MTTALWQRLAITIAGGVFMATLDFSPGHSDQGTWKFLLSLVLLFIALDGVGPRWGFRLGFIWGILAYGLNLSWFWSIFQGISAGLWSILALFTATFGSWYGTVTRDGDPALWGTRTWRAKKRSPLWLILLSAVVWTGLEYFRCEWFTLRFPWITPGTIAAPTPLSPIIGVYGITFILVFGGILAASRTWGIGVLALILAILGTISSRTGPASFPAPGQSLTVALVQSEQGFFEACEDLTRSIREPVDAIVWPEYAISYDIRLHPTDSATCRELLQKSGAKTLTLGSRTDLDNEGRYHNTAVTLGTDGTLGTHHKNRPVHFFSDGEPGRTQESFATPLGRIATPICFDCDYTAVVRRQVLHGAELLLVPSMDAKHWTAKQHEQHAQLFRHRAAENERWVAVAATSGVTQIIDPTGHVVDRLPTMTEDVLVGRVGLRRHLTFYTRIGWLLGPACTIATGAILLGTIAVRLGHGHLARDSQARRLGHPVTRASCP